MLTTKLQRRLGYFPFVSRKSDALTFDPDLVTYPAAEIVDTAKEYQVTIELPGLKKENVTIELEDGTLTIAGEKKEEVKDEHQQYWVFERSYGAFQRAFTFAIPVDPEKIVATMVDGVLTIRLPKIAAPTESAKKIAISEKP